MPKVKSKNTKRLISYVFPIYNEEGNVELLFKTISNILTPKLSQYQFEIIFVNDGSKDKSLEKLLALRSKDLHVKIINLSRNFGHQLAVTAGLDNARGDAVIIMDSDMQDPPRVSLKLIEKWEAGNHVVYAQRRTRKDAAFKRLTAYGFYWLLDKLADIQIPRNTGDFRLLDRKALDSLNQFREHNRFLRGMVSYIGFKQTSVLFDRDERYAGVTGYPMKKMLKFATDGILSFSWTPIKLISRIGYFFSLLSLVGIIYAIVMKLAYPHVTVPGWTLMIITILLIGGIQLVMLGILGSYIGRIYTEVQGRPLYIIESITDSDEPA